ncbi:HYR domain-containing protein [Chryseolinea soli]|uniref:HYR domain-containing protein n=1 Tax=Chryseolinea soli TaxID=2321403 RepID=A0A385SVS1_9BACT|nr:HYR domain-containing protein [Chryseolinea soli]AYB35054.1 HYR domain-containing protein [Chryseolinea soli]
MLSVDFVKRRKALFLGLLLVILGQWNVYGQGCSCPPITTCGCTVGLTKMTVQFTGLLGLTVDVQDGGGNIYTGLLLLPGSTFTVQSSAGAGNPFVGNQVTIRTTLLVLANINTSCTNQVKIGTTFGNFTVTGGESVGGAPICCLNMESTPPNFTSCPPNVDVPADASACGTNVTWTAPTVTDNCAVASVIPDHNPGDFFPVGTTVVKYTATDNYGNTQNCSFNVRVRDQTAPVFAGCPASFSVPVNPTTCNAVVNWTPPTATDNCDGAITPTSPSTSGTTLGLGPHTITYTAQDSEGNQSTCSFTVTVTDNTPPVLAGCPTDFSVAVNPVTCNAVVNWTAPTATDNCGGVITPTSPNVPGSTFALGPHTITYTANDGRGNQSTCSFVVTVTDNTAPVLAGCPTDFSVSVNPTTCDAVVNWTPPTATDNCAGSITPTSPDTPGATFALGTHTVTYTADDGNGNQSTCSFVVTVTDNTAPVFAGCPADFSVSVKPTTCDAVVNWTAPTATDNCVGPITPTSPDTPGATFALGPHTITYTADDGNGNQSTCSFVVTVTDNTAPVLVGCPADFSVSVNPTTCDAVVNWTPPTATDNCAGSITPTSPDAPGATFALGAHTITYTANDGNGNQSTCSFIVTVTDNTAPVLAGCPTDFSVSVNPTTCDAVVNWTPPTATDNCAVSITPTSPDAPGATFGLGAHTITYTADDGNGNQSTCSFVVTVTDNTAPVFAGCPTDFSVSVNPSTCDAIVNWTPPTATDNCAGPITPTSPDAPGATFALGAHTITYTADDGNGNQSTCSFVVTVTDNTAPVFAGCPADFSVSVNPTTCDAVVNWTPPTATDNCAGSIAPTSPDAPGATFALGAHTITYTADDGNGNLNTCSFVVTVTDNTAPVLAGCPTDFSVSVNPTTCDAVVNWTPPTATDNCAGSITPTSPDAPGATFALGAHTITYTADDGNGNQSTCSFVLTVTDNTAPVFAGCPADFSVSVNPATCDAVVNWTPPTATDNCVGSITPTSPDAPGATFALGAHTITYTADDGSGNLSTCSFIVTVTDNTAPVFAGCPADFSVAVDPATCDAIVNWTPPTATDNCAGSITPTSPDAPGATFALGAHTITYTADDGHGNLSTCSFVVNVTDNTAPVFAGCPADFSVSVNPTTCDAIVNWTPPTATDICAGSITPTSPDAPGATFALGAHTITYTADDGHGNLSTCSFVVTVTDNTAPVLVGCPTDFSVSTDPATCDAVVNWTPPTATDNCAGSVIPTSPDSPGATFTLGAHTITYTADDGHGNLSTCSFVVTVTDNTPPVLAGCPTDFSVSVDPATCDAIVNWTAPTATDNCAGALTPTSPDAPGATFALGVHTITYTADDGHGNLSTCSFIVTVTDNTPPVFAGCPADFSVSADPGSCDAVVNWTPPTATDNCAGSLVPTSPDAPGATFALGAHTITYTADDGHGNLSTCSFVVTVTDNTPPVFAGCPADFSVSVDPATCDAVVNWTPPTATDNCGPLTPTSPDAPGATFALGVHTITYTADDGHGNQSTCSFIVTVTDDTPPIFAGCPADFSVSVDPATCDAVVNWTPPTATDNCGPITPTSPDAPGATFALGTHTIAYTADDGHGNQSTCSFIVTVTDNTPPVFSGCPADFSVPVDPATCNAVVTWTPPTATDNCAGSITPTSPDAPGATFALGAHIITYTADDGHGNQNTCSFTVTVTDGTKPVFTNCPANISLPTDVTSCTAVATWVLPTVTDNCDATPGLSSNFNSGDAFTVGVHTVTYEATDAAGNKETCSFTVTVEDHINPTFTSCPSNIVASASATSCDATVSWVALTAGDNCTATPAVTSNFNPGDVFPIGVTTVTYTATDVAGNTTTCSFSVTVNDNTAPVFTGCPTAVTVAADASCQAVATWNPPVAKDNCSFTLTSNHNPGETFPQGTTPVIYTATDPAGNVTTCSFNVIVRDAIAPVFSNCPVDFTVAVGAGCGANVNWIAPAVTDNCTGTLTLTSDHAPGDFFAAGTTTVTYKATDVAGNVATCSFAVTVEDTTPPVFQNCPAQISVAADNSCGAVVNWTSPTASDNCSVSVVSTHQPGERFDIGTVEVVYTATDIYGNASVCRFNVTVRNEELPTFAGCPSDVYARCGESGQVVVSWEPPTATTRCGDLSLTGSHEPGETFSVGTTPVVYTAANDAGKTITCNFNVIVDYEELEIEVTKVVTPDGDGQNDDWIVVNIEKFARNKVLVLDRWGSVIYQASGYNNSTMVWNGVSSNGVQVPTGTYYYVIEVDFLQKHLKKSGFIELLR